EDDGRRPGQYASGLPVELHSSWHTSRGRLGRTADAVGKSSKDDQATGRTFERRAIVRGAAPLSRLHLATKETALRSAPPIPVPTRARHGGRRREAVRTERREVAR